MAQTWSGSHHSGSARELEPQHEAARWPLESLCEEGAGTDPTTPTVRGGAGRDGVNPKAHTHTGKHSCYDETMVNSVITEIKA